MKRITRRKLLAALPLTAAGHALSQHISPAGLAGLEALLQSASPASSPETTLWYRQPASAWTEANPIGNGSLGGMIFGGVEQEHLCLNEDTLWSGGPRDLQNRDAVHVLPQVRKLLLDGKNTEAQALVDKHFLGLWNESYMPLGDLFLDIAGSGELSDYRRELDLSTGVVRITYRTGEVRFTRQIFASNPDKLIAIRLSADRPGSLNLTANLKSQLHFATECNGAKLTMTGRCPAHVEPSYVAGSPEPVVWEDGPNGRGMRFEVQMRALQKGGSVSAEGHALRVSNADEVVFLLAAATSFNGFDTSPSQQGRDPAAICNRILSAAEKKPYANLLAAHTADHSGLFDRVKLDLSPSRTSAAAVTLPIDERIRAYEAGSDPILAALYFQFGRYLLIASSRPGTQPANLQGIWTNNIRPDWSANWTLNCNVEINYWAAETANLSECHLPLFDMIDELRVDGHQTARNMYGCDGWVAHHNADLWRNTTPVGGSARWAIWKMGGAWLCHHLWEHYLFNQDEAFLRRAYPAMREASVFFLDHMEPEQHGWLVDYPATSFENPFRKSDGTVANVCEGPAMDTQIIGALLSNTRSAAEFLKQDAALRLRLDASIKQLPPMQISARTGELQEWIDDWDAAEPHNGQIGHLWALMPGSQITPEHTPAIAVALRKTIDERQPWKYSTGSWVSSWTASSFARLHDSDAAASIMHQHLRKNVNPNMTANFNRADGTTAFQIDGNLGMTAAIGEMLMQSHGGEILLLPALPRDWQQGSVNGLCARGGFTVDIEWTNGKLLTTRFHVKKDGVLRVKYAETFVEIHGTSGVTYHLDCNLQPIKA